MPVKFIMEIKMDLHIGCSGWYYQHWKDSFYKNIPQNRWFSHYARMFGTVELNSTFYHFPKERTVAGWYRKAPENFVYSIKANRMITHLKRFSGTERIMKEFYDVVKMLDEKLGCVLFQLPPSIYFDMERLDGILSQLDPQVRNVIEFRHASWWNDEVFEKLKENNIIFCIVSAPDLPGNFIKTAKDIYVRFHGMDWYNYNYSMAELKEYAEKTYKAKPRNAWIYFNNDLNACAPENALELMELMKNENEN